MGSWFTRYPGRPDYFTHWGSAFKYAASLLGLPIGDNPHSRPPQAELPDEGRAQIRTADQRLGLIAELGRRGLSDPLRKVLPIDVQYENPSSFTPLLRRFAG